VLDPDAAEGDGPTTHAYLHTVTEALTRLRRPRSASNGDPRFIDVPIGRRLYRPQSCRRASPHDPPRRGVAGDAAGRRESRLPRPSASKGRSRCRSHELRRVHKTDLWATSSRDGPSTCRNFLLADGSVTASYPRAVLAGRGVNPKASVGASRAGQAGPRLTPIRRIAIGPDRRVHAFSHALLATFKSQAMLCRSSSTAPSSGLT